MMKPILVLIIFLSFGKIAFSQEAKKSIDYQYFRDDKSYYAFELFKSNSDELQLKLNFTANVNFKKIDKIIITDGNVEIKLKFIIRAEQVKSDNPEQKFYPIAFSRTALSDKKLLCEASIIFKLDNGNSYTLPFNTCSALAIN